MTASEIERRLTAVLHQHAEEAMNRTDTATELDTFHARVDQDDRGRHRRRAGTAAAALVVAAVAVGALWLGFGQGQSPTPVDPASPAGSPSPATPSEEPEGAQAPGSTVEGFEGVESFPMTYLVPEEFSVPSWEVGTRGYHIEGTTGDVAALVVGTLAQTPASDLPADLAAHLRQTRAELDVSNVGTAEVGGRPAQTFTLAQRPGTSPYDLVCARAGSCYKLLEDKPMDVTVVRTGKGLVLFWVEYAPEDRAEVQEPVQTWLSSVRWE